MLFSKYFRLLFIILFINKNNIVWKDNIRRMKNKIDNYFVSKYQVSILSKLMRTNQSTLYTYIKKSWSNTIFQKITIDWSFLFTLISKLSIIIS